MRVQYLLLMHNITLTMELKMKYFIFSIVLIFFVAAIKTIFLGFSLDEFVQGIGFGLGAIIFGSFGLLYKKNKFRGFVIASLFVLIISTIGSLQL